MDKNTFKIKTDLYRATTEAALAEFLLHIPQPLSAVMKYSVFAGGKRLRPCLLLAAWELMEGDGATRTPQVAMIRPLAVAIEMIHTYSLVHDDLPCMDNDDFRRGKLTSHKVYGEATAVLCGDALLNYSYELMINAAMVYGKNLPKYLEAIFKIAQGAGAYGMIDGQIQDLLNESSDDAGIDELRGIHEKKTGALICASVCAGALASTKPPMADDLRALETFAKQFGLLFQITDDILDVCGDTTCVGKTLGKDAKCGKLTYPKLYGIDKSRELAQTTAQEAKNALTVFGGDAQYLCALTDYVLERDM